VQPGVPINRCNCRQGVGAVHAAQESGEEKSDKLFGTDHDGHHSNGIQQRVAAGAAHASVEEIGQVGVLIAVRATAYSGGRLAQGGCSQVCQSVKSTAERGSSAGVSRENMSVLVYIGLY
jgi:hypothetical protein